MRKLVTLALTLLLAPAAASGDEFPFDGYVSSPSAAISSGPGKRFYITDRLPRGTKVDVYREEASGWLAIRPPEGSFCWLPAEEVERLDETTGKVRAATPCWIGTHVERVSEHKSQVTLKAGELIEILGEKTVEDAAGASTWLKIAPPAGEFRYVSGQDVSRQPVPDEPPEREQPIDDNRQRVADEGEEAGDPQPQRFDLSGPAISIRDIADIKDRMAALKDELAELGGRRPSAAEGTAPVEAAQYRSPVEAEPQRTLSTDGFVARKRRTMGQLPAGAAQSINAPAFTRPNLDPSARLADSRGGVQSKTMEPSAAARPGAPSTAAPIPGEEVARELEKIELELSLMLAQDKSTWNLAALRQRIEQLVERGATPTDRGTARLALEKIKQFEATFNVEDYAPIATATPAGSSTAPAAAAEPRYDATGWLKPVISRSKPAAPYAVVDSEGNPLCFVSPSPGLNLNRYLNQQVGIFGRRGYLEDLKKPHVVAERVIDLERHLR
jgi:hypothetical protein